MAEDVLEPYEAYGSYAVVLELRSGNDTLKQIAGYLSELVDAVRALEPAHGSSHGGLPVPMPVALPRGEAG